ncbi:hypothetical protein BASA81_015431 [Batrachochytrium salamandrivorans]|nr:hypothetical protein BASA81_015431 [Batrachochytrium salamandrivorans]
MGQGPVAASSKTTADRASPKDEWKLFGLLNSTTTSNALVGVVAGAHTLARTWHPKSQFSTGGARPDPRATPTKAVEVIMPGERARSRPVGVACKYCGGVGFQSLALDLELRFAFTYCARCRETNVELKACSGCMMVAYCSEQCQAAIGNPTTTVFASNADGP